MIIETQERKRVELELKYDIAYKTKVTVDVNGNIMQFFHKREDILALEYAIDVATGENSNVIMLEGIEIDITIAKKLVMLGKQINVDIYDHLWEKKKLVYDLTDETQIDDIQWEYNIEQVYTIN